MVISIFKIVSDFGFKKNRLKSGIFQIFSPVSFVAWAKKASMLPSLFVTYRDKVKNYCVLPLLNRGQLFHVMISRWLHVRLHFCYSSK